jgi:hypothetical protein
MNLIPDRIGGNPKQLAWLGGLVVVLAVVYFMERTPDSPTVTPTAPVKTLAPIARQQAGSEAASSPKTMTRSGKSKDDNFRPSIKLPEGIDVTRIDPTLKLDLLAKLQKVPLEGGSRSVFDWGQAPVPPPPHVDPIKPEVIAEQKRQAEEADKFAREHPPKPPVAPIPLKFYGYANRLSGRARQAFFLDGDDIQIKSENDVIRGRYKIIRIGINSATVEDLTSHDQQTLPLVAELNT